MALVVHQDQLFFTTENEHPVGSLIEAIWTYDPDQARAITRNRIFTRIPLTPLCEGMLKVAAKRCTLLSSADYQDLWDKSQSTKILVPLHHPHPTLRTLPFQIEDKIHSEEEAMQVAMEISTLSKLEIGAVLLNAEGKIVSWGWNDHFPNKIIHAEIMLVKNFLAKSGLKKIPPSYTLITTLQPCSMCAGYLHEHCEDWSKMKIVFQKTDPGPFAQNSILVPGSDLHRKFFRC